MKWYWKVGWQEVFCKNEDEMRDLGDLSMFEARCVPSISWSWGRHQHGKEGSLAIVQKPVFVCWMLMCVFTDSNSGHDVSYWWKLLEKLQVETWICLLVVNCCSCKHCFACSFLADTARLPRRTIVEMAPLKVETMHQIVIISHYPFPGQHFYQSNISSQVSLIKHHSVVIEQMDSYAVYYIVLVFFLCVFPSWGRSSSVKPLLLFVFFFSKKSMPMAWLIQLAWAICNIFFPTKVADPTNQRGR